MQAIATDRPKVKVSKMSGKLDGIRAINTNTVTNPFCIKMKEGDSICGQCYSHRMLNTFRKSCQPAFEHNSQVLSEGPLELSQLPDFYPGEYIRFHGHGELINREHLLNFFRIARYNPETTFALWTKRKDIVKSVGPAPDNLILIFSNPKIDNVMTEPPKGFDRVFNNVTGDADANCTGQKCMECLLCYRKDTTKIIVEHVK